MRYTAVRRLRLPALFMLGLAAVALPAVAEPVFEAMPLQARTGALTLDQAIEMAERRFHARVVRASLDESNGQRVYVLRMLSEQGRVWTVRVDAQTGSIL